MGDLKASDGLTEYPQNNAHKILSQFRTKIGFWIKDDRRALSRPTLIGILKILRYIYGLNLGTLTGLGQKSDFDTLLVKVVMLQMMKQMISFNYRFEWLNTEELNSI